MPNSGNWLKTSPDGDDRPDFPRIDFDLDDLIMEAKVLSLHLPDTSPEPVILEALERGLSSVIIIGWDSDGDLYIDSSRMDVANAIYLIEAAKHWLLHDHNPEDE